MSQYELRHHKKNIAERIILISILIVAAAAVVAETELLPPFTPKAGACYWSGSFSNAYQDNTKGGTPVFSPAVADTVTTFTGGIGSPSYLYVTDCVGRCAETWTFYGFNSSTITKWWITNSGGATVLSNGAPILSNFVTLQLSKLPGSCQNGGSIGTPQISNYTLTFNAASLPNGTYTLNVDYGHFNINPDSIYTFPLTVSHGTPLTCSPASSPATPAGQPISFTAAGGLGIYTWTATGGAPSSGSGSSFSTSFSAAGAYPVKVSDGTNSATCTANVTGGSCSCVLAPPYINGNPPCPGTCATKFVASPPGSGVCTWSNDSCGCAISGSESCTPNPTWQQGFGSIGASAASAGTYNIPIDVDGYSSTGTYVGTVTLTETYIASGGGTGPQLDSSWNATLKNTSANITLTPGSSTNQNVYVRNIGPANSNLNWTCAANAPRGVYLNLSVCNGGALTGGAVPFP